MTTAYLVERAFSRSHPSKAAADAVHTTDGWTVVERRTGIVWRVTWETPYSTVCFQQVGRFVRSAH